MKKSIIIFCRFCQFCEFHEINLAKINFSNLDWYSYFLLHQKSPQLMGRILNRLILGQLLKINKKTWLLTRGIKQQDIFNNQLNQKLSKSKNNIEYTKIIKYMSSKYNTKNKQTLSKAFCWRHSIQWCCGLAVITTMQLNSTKTELRFCVASNPTCEVWEVFDGENLWQWSYLEIRLTAIH